MTVFNVNGVDVSSDKRLASINGSRITFTDGSWYDVRTGQTVNNGTGYITVGVPAAAKTQKLRAPSLFTASGVECRTLVANVRVIVWNRPQVEVSIEGPSDEVDAISVEKRGDTVVIQGQSQYGNSGNTTVIRNGNSTVTIGGRGRIGQIISGDYVGGNLIVGDSVSGISIGGGSINIGGVNISGGGENATTVTVRVPVKTAITLDDISGSTPIGDTLGRVTARVGAGDTNIGTITALDLNVKGSGDTTVRTMNGPCSVNLMGSGDVRINAGRMPQLSVNVMGSGDVTVGGIAETAGLSLMGSGDIRVASVTNQPMINKMGSGSIRVGNW